MVKNFNSILDKLVGNDKEEVRQMYLRVAQKYHPDVITESDAKEQFVEMNHAYKILSDHESRHLLNLLNKVDSDTVGAPLEQEPEKPQFDFSSVFSQQLFEKPKKPKLNFFSAFSQQLKDDFEYRRHIYFLELIGLVCIISSDLSVTTLTDKTPFLITFPVYLVGACSMVCASYFRKNGFGLILYCIFFLIYAYGLSKLLFYGML